MIIALDLDGVVYEWDKTARYMLRRKLTQEARPIPTELFMPSRHWDSVQHAVTPEDWSWLWNEGVDLGLFRYGHCVTGSIEGVEALGNLGEVVIVTARPHRAIQDTHAWIGFMFNRAKLADIVFDTEKHGVDADVFIDDAAHNALSLAAAGKRVLIYDQPWNWDIAHSVGTRVHNWTGVVDAVKELLP